MPKGIWTREEFLNRVHRLRQQGFTPEESWDIAGWKHELSHWVISNLRRDRRVLIKSWRDDGMIEEEIDARLTQRYVALGVRGQYEDEEWYVARVGA